MTSSLVRASGFTGSALLVLAVAGCGSGSSHGPQVFTQVDRAGKPAVNAIVSSVAGGRRQANVIDTPADDAGRLRNDVTMFMTGPAGRSAATAQAAAALLVPNLLVADLGQPGPAAYLAAETHGMTDATQHAVFGGRSLADDAIDTDLGVIFGSSIARFGLAPDDGKETPALTSDHVDAPRGFVSIPQFPYLGPPQ